MSAPIAVGVRNARVRSVADGHYLPTLKGLVARARTRCLCSVFIVDPRPWGDANLVVDGVLEDLREALWRGVDVRLLVGGSRSNLAIAEASATARRRATALGIPCRWLTAQRTRGSHAKVVIADDDVLTGSHNWSAGAFASGQTQDSVLVRSPALATFLAAQYETDWLREASEHV